MKPGQRHVIFDLDGTIFDTEFEVSRITADIAAEKGAAMPVEDVFRTFAGLSGHDKFKGIGASCGLTFNAEELSAMNDEHEARKQQIYYRPSIPVVPGVPEVLEALQAAGDVLSIGSSNPTTRSRLGLGKENLLRYFGDRLYGPDLVGERKKPDPAVFQRAMHEQGSDPRHTVVIEDTEPGIVAGYRTGAFVIAYLDPRFGNGAAAQKKEQSFRAAGANVVVRDFRDIPKVMPAADAAPQASRKPPQKPQPFSSNPCRRIT